METYRKGMRRILLLAILTAAIIATAVLIASLQFPDDPWVEPEVPLDAHSADLPTASLTLIIDGGPSGTQVIGNLEFGFVNRSWDYFPGFYSDCLQVQNGFNKSSVRGLSYVEERHYAFAYLGEDKLYDEWTNRTPGSASGPGDDTLAWTPNDRYGSHHGGHLPIENRSDISMAGFVIEFVDLSIHFADGSSFLCGPENLYIGVNFTQVDNIWQVNYIIEVSDYEGVVMGTDSVTLHLDEEIPEKTEEPTDTEPTPEHQIGVGIAILVFPAFVALVAGLVVLVASRKGVV